MTRAEEGKADWVQGSLTTVGLVRGEKSGSVPDKTGRGDLQPRSRVGIHGQKIAKRSPWGSGCPGITTPQDSCCRQTRVVRRTGGQGSSDMGEGGFWLNGLSSFLTRVGPCGEEQGSPPRSGSGGEEGSEEPG